MPSCFLKLAYLQYDGSNGQDIVDLIAETESNSTVTWSLVSEIAGVATINWHGDQDQPYTINTNDYVVCDFARGWVGLPMSSTEFNARYEILS